MLLFFNVCSMCFLGFRVVFFNHELQFFWCASPHPKPNLQTLVHVLYNTHCRTLTKLQSKKMCSKLANCKKKVCKSIKKNTHLRTAKLTSHIWIFFWGQANIYNYSFQYPFTHATIPKGTQFIKKKLWNKPLHQS